MSSTRALGYSERTAEAWTMPGRATSSQYSPRPSTLSRTSERKARSPTLQGGVHGPLPPQDGPGQGDALYDLLVPGAAAHIAPNGLLDLILGGNGILVQKGLAREDHTRDTKAALHRSHRAESVDKGLLLGLGEPLYGEDVLSHRLFCGQDTGPHGLSVHHDGTGAACPLAASVLHGGEMQVVPQIAQQRLSLIHI